MYLSLTHYPFSYCTEISEMTLYTTFYARSVSFSDDDLYVVFPDAAYLKVQFMNRGNAEAFYHQIEQALLDNIPALKLDIREQQKQV